MYKFFLLIVCGLFISFQAGELQQLKKDYSECACLNGYFKKDSRYTDPDTAAIVVQLYANNLTVAECVEHTFNDKKEKAVEAVIETVAKQDPLEAQEIRKRLVVAQEINRRIVIDEVVCAHGVPDGICAYMKEQLPLFNARKRQLMLPSDKPIAKKLYVRPQDSFERLSYQSTVATMFADMPISQNKILKDLLKHDPQQLINKIQLGIFLSEDVLQVNNGGNKITHAPTKGILNHEFEHIFQGDGFGPVVFNKNMVHALPFRKLLRCLERRADMVPAAFSQERALQASDVGNILYLWAKDNNITYDKTDSHPHPKNRMTMVYRLCHLKYQEALFLQKPQEQKEADLRSQNNKKAFDAFLYSSI